MNMTDALSRGRESFARRAWEDAFSQLSAADEQASLAAEDLECLATAAFLTGRTIESTALWTRAHGDYLSRTDIAGAAWCAFRLGFGLLNTGEPVRGAGWISQAKRLLDEHQLDCVEQGYVLFPEGVALIIKGDGTAAHALFERAAEIGRRFADRDLVVLARHGMGRSLIRLGRVGQGVGLLDEAMIAVEAGDVSPLFAGDIYCSVIEACLEIFDVRRAQEWTAALTHWCDSQPDLVAYSGQCLVRRAEIMQLHGEWAAAADVAQGACERFLRGPEQPAIAAAFYQRGELARVRGDFAKADEAYREASRRGRKPQPGLALLRLAQGQIDVAAAAIRGAIDEARGRTSRCRLLPAYVEIMVSANDVEAASAAANELGEMTETLDAPLLRAVAAQALGAVLLARRDSRGALAALRSSWAEWREIGAPHELGRVRVLIGLACRELGDHATAEMEFDAARWAFQQLSAAPDLKRLESLTRQAAPQPSGGLTARELEVLRLVAAGHTNRVVGEKLSISEKTVARHVANIFTKLDLTSRAAATAYAYQHGLT
jgi:DNA-binding CsgD family transcriptional regulator